MINVHDVNANDLIAEVAAKLEEMKIDEPEFTKFVKTGVHKERPPVQNNWWFLRCAAILRTVTIKGPIGTSKLRTKYGGNKNRGHAPEHHYKGSGAVIRNALQSLEKAGLLEQKEIAGKKGRVVKGEGQKLIDSCAKAVFDKSQVKGE